MLTGDRRPRPVNTVNLTSSIGTYALMQLLAYIDL